MSLVQFLPLQPFAIKRFNFIKEVNVYYVLFMDPYIKYTILQLLAFLLKLFSVLNFLDFYFYLWVMKIQVVAERRRWIKNFLYLFKMITVDS